MSKHCRKYESYDQGHVTDYAQHEISGMFHSNVPVKLLDSQLSDEKDQIEKGSGYETSASNYKESNHKSFVNVRISDALGGYDFPQCLLLTSTS